MSFLGIEKDPYADPIDWVEVVSTTLCSLIWVVLIAAAWYVWGVSGIVSGVGTAYLFLTEPWHWGFLGLLALPLLIVIGLFMDD